MATETVQANNGAVTSEVGNENSERSLDAPSGLEAAEVQAPGENAALAAGVEGKDDSTPPPGGTDGAEGAEKVEKAAAPDFFEVEINGNAEKVALPDLLEGYKAALEGSDLILEAKKSVEQSERTLKRVAEDPRGAFIEIFTGVLGSRTQAQEYLESWAEEIVVEKYKKEQLPAEERLKAKYEAEIKERDEKLKQFEEETKNKSFEERKKQLEGEIMKVFVGMADKLGVANTKRARTKFNMYMASFLTKNGPGGNLSYEQAGKKAIDQMRQDALDALSGMPATEIVGMRPGLAEELRKLNLAKAQEVRSKKTERSENGREVKERKYSSPAEWRRSFTED